MAQPNQARVCAESTVYTVRVEPQGIELAARHGETVMAAAERLGWKWPTICHGDGECSVCWVKVIDGSAHISPMSEDERATLELLPSSIVGSKDSSPVRLACQARILGDATVAKRGVTPQDGAR